MTAINNLKGSKVKDGIILYSEKLDNGLIFNVIQMYENVHERGNCTTNPKLWIEACISDGTKTTYSNGVIGLNEKMEQQYVPEKDDFPPLQKETKTSMGFRVFQSVWGEFKYITPDGLPFKARYVVWVIDVPKKDMIKILIKENE